MQVHILYNLDEVSYLSFYLQIQQFKLLQNFENDIFSIDISVEVLLGLQLV